MSTDNVTPIRPDADPRLAELIQAWPSLDKGKKATIISIADGTDTMEKRAYSGAAIVGLVTDRLLAISSDDDPVKTDELSCELASALEGVRRLLESAD